MSQQTNEQVNNPGLVAAMREMVKNNNEYTRGKMAEALMDAKLLSPVERQTLLLEKSGPSTRIRFEEIKNTEGHSYYMAFTDLDEYNKWNEDGSHGNALIVTMEDFGNLLIRSINDFKGFVINPYSENVSISKDLLLSLLKQREARQHANKSS